jgi:hypothetical protein
MLEIIALEPQVESALAAFQRAKEAYECLTEQLTIAEDTFKSQRAEELASRRTSVVIPRPAGPREAHVGPSRHWKAAKATQDRFTAYVYTKGRSPRLTMLARRVSASCAHAMHLHNTQAWNPRNPNPHLP